LDAKKHVIEAGLSLLRGWSIGFYVGNAAVYWKWKGVSAPGRFYSESEAQIAEPGQQWMSVEG
jgi:hypothetical protein